MREDGKKMNAELEKFARQNLITGLAKLPENHVTMFKRVYSRGVARTTPIETVVAKMGKDKLDWAMQQVAKFLQKIEGK